MKNDNQLHFKFCPFSENLLKKVLREEPADKTVFIFPTEVNKKSAIRLFQADWNFINTLFLTMEELKGLVFRAEHPILKEEKRTLAFYSALTYEHKKHFRLNNYFQSIELAQRFFEFWEEFNEELVDEQNVLKKISSAAELFQWQREVYRYFVEIKFRYQKFIAAKQFDDNIFIRKPENLNFQFFRDYDQFVVVNQYYYTQLEKAIFSQIAESGKSVTIYYQQTRQHRGEEIFSSEPVSVPNIREEDCRTKSIDIFECKNDFSMITSLLRAVHQFQISHIIDPSFWDKPYSQFLAIDKFNINSTVNFTNTSIYRFFFSVYQLVDSLIYDSEEQNQLLPIQALLDAVLIDDFFNYFINDIQPASCKKAQEQTLDFIYGLIEDDYKYLDLQKKFLHFFPTSESLTFILLMIDFLNNVLLIDSISALISKIDERHNLFNIESIITEHERNYYEIKETFFQAVGDFSTIETLNFIPEYDQLFGAQKDKNEVMTKSAGILKLFVDYLKAKKVRMSYGLADENVHRIRINNLEDTRNVAYEKVAVLNLSEDSLPRPRQTQFLFTENQRKILGLKTYDEVRERERYYFFRLLFNSEQVYLFTLKNIDQNLDRSSFLEEIFLHKPEGIPLRTTHVADKNYRTVYRQFLENSDYRVSKSVCRQPDFFKFPVNKEIDFPENNLNLTPYSMAALLDNPFAFYITQLYRLDEKIKKVETDFSSKLIGIIVHDVIHQIWHQLIEQEQGPLFGFDFGKVNSNQIKSAVTTILGKYENYYKLPKNYSQTYFSEIIVPIIEEGAKEFFQKLSEKTNFQSKNIEVIPEKEYGRIEEKTYKTFIPADENEFGLNIRIRGRADLRIILPDAPLYSIFDYKTGGYNANQLLVYELYYYLIEQPEMTEQVESYFYLVFDKKLEALTSLLKRKTKEEKIESLKRDLIEAVNRIAANGFDLPTLKSKLGLKTEISRTDLYLPLMRKFNQTDE